MGIETLPAPKARPDGSWIRRSNTSESSAARAANAEPGAQVDHRIAPAHGELGHGGTAGVGICGREQHIAVEQLLLDSGFSHIPLYGADHGSGAQALEPGGNCVGLRAAVFRVLERRAEHPPHVGVLEHVVVDQRQRPDAHAGQGLGERAAYSADSDKPHAESSQQGVGRLTQCAPLPFVAPVLALVGVVRVDLEPSTDQADPL